MRDKVADELTALLSEERAVIRNGAFDELEALMTRKVALFERLAAQKSTGMAIRRIRKAMADNQTLLAAAMKGVEAGRNRLQALQNVRNGLQVYDPSGQMAKVATKRPAFEKRS